MSFRHYKSFGIFLLVLNAFAFVEPAKAADRLIVDHSKKPIDTTSGLGYEYTFKVKSHQSAKIVEGADFIVATDMPSMPGAHHMPHVRSEPGHHPGTYTIKLDFDMPGEWNLILKFSKPFREQVVIRDTVEKQGASTGNKTDHSTHNMDHSGHSHKKKKE